MIEEKGTIVSISPVYNEPYKDRKTGEDKFFQKQTITIDKSTNPMHLSYITLQIQKSMFEKIKDYNKNELVRFSYYVGGRNLFPSKKSGVEETFNNITLTRIDKI